MLKKIASFALLMLIAFASCKKVVDLVGNILTVEVNMNQEITFDAKGLIPSGIPDWMIEQYKDTTIMANEIPEVKENYSFNLDSTIKAETNNNFSLQNLKSARFRELKLILPADTEIKPENIDVIRIKAQANDGSQPYIVEQFGDFKMTTDSISQKKNLYLSTLDTERDVINQLKASGVEYSIYAKFNKSIPVRLKDEFKLIVGYKLTVKK